MDEPGAAKDRPNNRSSEDKAKMKLDEWRLHKAHHFYQTRNWKEMQNEQARHCVVGE